MSINGNSLGRLRLRRDFYIRKNAADIIGGERGAFQEMLLHLVDNLNRPIDVIGFAGNEEIMMPSDYSDIEGVSHHSKVGIGRPEQFELSAGCI